MSCSRKILISAGLFLAICGMTYGLWYAIWDEHQTLVGMGVALATAFANAASGDITAAHAAIDNFASINKEYILEVHGHSHMIALGMLMVLLGGCYDRVAYSEKLRFYIAAAMAVGALLFPLGVFAQFNPEPLPQLGKLMSMSGSGLVIVCFALITIGLFKTETES
jgi:hypothetical protein